MSAIFLLTLRLLCTVFACLLLLRAYLKFLRAPGNDPITSFAYTTTQWAVGSVSKFIPRTPTIDWPSIFVCYLVAVIYQFFHWLMGSGPGDFSHFSLVPPFWWCTGPLNLQCLPHCFSAFSLG